MLNKAPRKCPSCGAKGTMVKSKQQRTKISVSKAVVGTCVAGPLGMLVGGLMGNKKFTYKCTECGFEKEPDTIV